jgi:hypothetical protein
MIDLLKLLGGLLVGLFRSHAAREAETAFLRHQLVVLRRSAPARLRLRAAEEHAVACNHALEMLLGAYRGAAGIAGDPEGPLFRTVPSRAARKFTRNPLSQQDAHRTIQRRATAVGSRRASATTRSARPASPST